MLDADGMPGVTNLVAHAAREISNALPRYLDLPIPARVDYVRAFDAVAKSWADVVRDAPNSAAAATEDLPDAHTDSLIPVQMPVGVLTTLDDLVSQHRRSREWTRRRRLHLAVNELDLASENEVVDEETPGPAAAIVDRWHKINGWFEAAVHLRDSGKSAPTVDECRRNFQQLEDVLFALLAPHYTVSGEVNDILADANS